MTGGNWQFYWRRWHLCWVRNVVESPVEGVFLRDNVVCIGPLQMRWWS